jgi:hypothetical protein
VVALDGAGNAVYNDAGEVGDSKTSDMLDRLLNRFPVETNCCLVDPSSDSGL